MFDSLVLLSGHQTEYHFIETRPFRLVMLRKIKTHLKLLVMEHKYVYDIVYC